MSYETWHTYGYGICVSNIKEPPVSRLQHLLHCAPEVEASVNEWLADCEIEQPIYEDYMEYDQDYQLGLATILCEVIQEAEGVIFTPCDDFDGWTYLVYQPSYPWALPENEAQLTEERIAEILGKYVRMLTDEEITIDYFSVENGG